MESPSLEPREAMQRHSLWEVQENCCKALKARGFLGAFSRSGCKQRVCGGGCFVDPSWGKGEGAGGAHLGVWGRGGGGGEGEGEISFEMLFLSVFLERVQEERTIGRNPCFENSHTRVKILSLA